MPQSGMPGDFAVTENAFAKINLALHVTGRRADGYHLLDMLVTFAEHGDRLGFSASGDDGLSLSGRFASRLSVGDGNLVVKARDLLRDAVVAAGQTAAPVHIHLEKNLPIASGIGGGSADAAATLRGLLKVWKAELPHQTLASLAVRLGADVPMCLESRPLIARGIGEEILPVPAMPSFALVLGNPLIEISTPEVFRRLERKNNPPLAILERPRDIAAWISIIKTLRNDLEAPARMLIEDIGTLSDMLMAEGALLARMSGSGATCFGLFYDMQEAARAAAALHGARPDWYFKAVKTVTGVA
ncbi:MULTISPECIES: 4-(cytidine 5'-diphospho)-2-C-methyl-D-erythritol kinase [unclassified Sinorhizobium]|uniref:4-(cytidine 5'-diphospho)-2-C-methyl-D-erythritol kinase n=1 Tax=unclassified Sinorhizobium TaxID=2613772 RepID=UPI003526685C